MIIPLLDAWLDTQRTVLDETVKFWQRSCNVWRVPALARDVAVATTPHDVVYEEDTLKLLRYCTERTVAEPIIVCFALVNRPYILDLQPDRSVIRQLLKRGFEVYLIDWGVPTAADRSLKLNDYVCGFLKNVVSFVCEHSGTSQVNLLGYCMGGTMSTMFTSLYPDLVRNLILMAAPIDFSGDEGLLNVWTREKFFDVDALIDAFGNCPGAFLQGCFQMMKPIQNYSEKYVTFLDKMHDETYIENFIAMEQWSRDNIPVAGETFREFVKMLYQRNLLVKNQLYLDGQLVKLDRITCPLLMLVADEDHLVPPSMTLPLRDYVKSEDVQQMAFPGGHIGLAVSSSAHRRIWPDAAMWIADRSTERLYK